MKTVVIPDTHGKVEVIEKALMLVPTYKVIFMGDYLDDFTRTVEDQVKGLKLVLGAMQEYPDYVVGLLGNHELSYMNPAMVCSGYKHKTKMLVQHLPMQMLPIFEWDNGFLLTHAGITNTLPSLKEFKNIEDYLYSNKFDEDVFRIGRGRGGQASEGGPLWCDWFREFEPIPGVKQIVGHSGYRPNILPIEMTFAGKSPQGILRWSDNYNIDCLNYVEEILVLDDGEAFVVGGGIDELLC